MAITVGNLLVRLGADVGPMERQLRGAAAVVKNSFVGPVLAAGATLTAVGVGVLALAEKATRSADELQKLSIRTGITVEKLSALRLVTQLNDATMEQLGTAAAKLARNMNDMDRGTGAARRTFAELNIPVKDASGQLRNVFDVMLDVADAMQRGTSDTRTMAAAQELLGKGGAALIPLLKQGSAAIKEQMEEARALGGVMSTEVANAAAQMQDDMTRLQFAVKATSESLGLELMPSVQAVITVVLKGTQAIRGLAGEFASLFVGAAPTAAKEIADIDKQIRGLGTLRIEAGIEGNVAGVADIEKQVAALERRRAMLMKLVEAGDMFAASNVGQGRGMEVASAAAEALEAEYQRLMKTVEELNKRAPELNDQFTAMADSLDAVRDAANELERSRLAEETARSGRVMEDAARAAGEQDAALRGMAVTQDDVIAGEEAWQAAMAGSIVWEKNLNAERERSISLLSAMGALFGDVSNLLGAFGVNVGGGLASTFQRVIGGLRSVQGIGRTLGELSGASGGGGGGGGLLSSPAFNILGLGRSVGSVLGIGGGAAATSAALGAAPTFASGLAADAALSAGAGAAGAASILGPIGIAVGLGALAFSFFGKSGRAKELEKQAKLLEESFAALKSTLRGVNEGLSQLAGGALGRGAAAGLASGLAGLPGDIERFSGVTRNRLRLFGPTRELAGTVAEGVVSLLGGEAGVRAVATSGAFPASFFSGLVNRRFELPVGPEGIFSDAQLGKRADIQRSLFLSRLAGAGFEISGVSEFGREAPEHGLTAGAPGAGTVVVQGLEQIAELFRVFASPGDLDRVRAFNEEFAQFLETLQQAAEGFTQRTFARAQEFAGVIETVSGALFQLRPPTAQAQLQGALESFAAFSRVLAEGGAGAGPEGLQNIFEGLTGAATRFATVLETLRQENVAASRAVEDLTNQQRLARQDIAGQAFEASLRGLTPEAARAARIARLQAQRADIAARLAAPELQPASALELVGQGRDVLQRLLELQSQNADLTIEEFALGRDQMVAELQGLAGISDQAFAAQISAQQGIIDANQAILAELGMGGSFVAAQEMVRAALEAKLEDVRASAAAGFNEQADLLRAIDTNTERLAQLGLIETRLGELNTLFAGRREAPTAEEIAAAARVEVPDFSSLQGTLDAFPAQLGAALSGALLTLRDEPSPQSMHAPAGAVAAALSPSQQGIWEQIQSEARDLLARGVGADVIGTFIRVRQQSLGFEGIPAFQHGGVVRRPTLALLGEGGEEEWVVPGRMMRRGGGGGGGLTQIEINSRDVIQLVGIDGQVVAELIWPRLKRLMIEDGRRGGLFADADGRLNGS